MESAQILAQIDTEEETPLNWIIFPLIRKRIVIDILGWMAGAVFGGLLFVFMASIMIPHNYQIGAVAAIISTLLLGIVLFVCLGSLWTMVADILRLRDHKQHVIIITPDDFVKQEGKKTTHVPLEYVKYVTARGAPQVDRSLETARADGKVSSAGEHISGLFIGRRIAESGRKGLGRRRMRTPTTLAFIDSRSDREVIVATDRSFGDPYYIAAHLKQYASQCQARVH